MQAIHQTLIDSELVKPSELAEAMLTQLESTPLALRELFNKELITADQVINIIDLQQQESLSLKQACESLKIWNDEYQEALNARVEDRKCLSEILLDKGFLEAKDLINKLEQISASLEKTEGKLELQAVDNVVDLETNSATENTDVDFEPSFWTLDKISEGPVLDYLDLFSQEKQEGLENAILRLGSSGNSADDIDSILDETFRDYHSIKGASRTVSAPVTEKLIHGVEDIIAFFKTYQTQLQSGDFENLVTINLSVLDAIWELRCCLEEHQTEEPIWSDAAKQSLYKNLLSELGEMQAKLEDKNLSVQLDEMEDLF